MEIDQKANRRSTKVPETPKEVGKEMRETKTEMVPGTVVYYQGTLKIHTNRSQE